jgi:hypothetical protein
MTPEAAFAKLYVALGAVEKDGVLNPDGAIVDDAARANVIRKLTQPWDHVLDCTTPEIVAYKVAMHQ